MTKDHRNKLEAFEMWLWRRMLKINWTDKVSNQQVLARIQEERSLINSIQQRKHKWLGHVLRHDGLLHRILEGRMEGKRGRGRRRQRMTDDIMGKESYEDKKGEQKIDTDGNGEDNNRLTMHDNNLLTSSIP